VKLASWPAFLMTGALMIAQNSLAEDEYPQKDSAEAAVYRGGIVFMHYCQLCHGLRLMGKGVRRSCTIQDLPTS